MNDITKSGALICALTRDEIFALTAPETALERRLFELLQGALDEINDLEDQLEEAGDSADDLLHELKALQEKLNDAERKIELLEDEAKQDAERITELLDQLEG